MSADDRIFYAIGDVHGERDKLAALHARVRDHHDQAHAGKGGVLVHLGDYVDRGPDSHGVVSDLMALCANPWPNFEILALKGNHEELMLKALDDPDGPRTETWFENGGASTLRSYAAAADPALLAKGADEWPALVARDHIMWLVDRPTMHWATRRGYVFVHAGIDPKRFPHCEDAVRMWTRTPAFLDPSLWPDRPELFDVVVVHGHTPTETLEAEILDQRINVDTGAAYGGKLTAVALAPRLAPVLISVD